MIKSFDCVEMKNKAGKKISKKLSRMTPAKQLAYWRGRHKKLVVLQRRLKKTISSKA